jgi:hypothetical protein
VRKLKRHVSELCIQTLQAVMSNVKDFSLSFDKVGKQQPLNIFKYETKTYPAYFMPFNGNNSQRAGLPDDSQNL